MRSSLGIGVLGLVLVYVCAVMVLFLSGHDVGWNSSSSAQEFVRLLALADRPSRLLVFAIINVTSCSIWGGADLQTAPALAADYSNTRRLGVALFTRYAFRTIRPVILVVASVAAIVLTFALSRQAASRRTVHAGSPFRAKTGANRQNGSREKTIDSLTYVHGGFLSGVFYLAIAVPAYS